MLLQLRASSDCSGGSRGGGGGGGEGGGGGGGVSSLVEQARVGREGTSLGEPIFGTEKLEHGENMWITTLSE